MMTITKKSGTFDRMVLIGMIVDQSVLASIASKWTKEGLFSVSWCNLIGTWCVNYYNEHGKPPSHHIEHLFQAWADDGKTDKETAKLVEKFLMSISGQYQKEKKKLNSEFVIDKAATLFNRVKLQKHAETIQGYVDANQLDKAVKKANEFEPVSIGKGSAVSLFRDFNAIDRAFANKSEQLIEYPGALGKFWNRLLTRDSFVGIMGREKSGKTYWLLDIAYRAALQRKKVLFFEIGDLSEGQILMRFATRAAGMPADEEDTKLKWPVKIERVEGGSYSYNLTTKEKIKKVITPQIAKDALAKISKEKIRTVKDDYLMIETYPNDSIGIAGIKSVCMQYVRKGWVPDFVVIDYADLLETPAGMEGRDGINKSWKGMRRLSQELHCCLVTATQSDADSYSSSLMNMTNFSEDKRKYAHVTAMVTLNRTDDEMEDQVTRLAQLLVRESKCSLKRVTFAAGCFAVANPAVTSC